MTRKRKKRKNVSEMNFNGRFSGELCSEIVQQFTSKGPINCFGGLSNIFISEGSPIYLPNLGSKFSRTKNFCFENCDFTRIWLRQCEGVG